MTSAAVTPLALALSEDFVKEQLATVEHELLFIWLQAKIPLDIQASMVALGFTSVGVFVNMEPTKDDLRALLLSELRWKPDMKLQTKSAIAKILGAWDTAQKRGLKRKDREADEAANDLPLALPKNTHNLMLRSFSERHGPLKDERTPAREYVDSIVSGLSTGNLIAEHLKEVITQEEASGNLGLGPRSQ